MDPILEEALSNTIKGYNKLYKEHALPKPIPTNMKNEAMSIIRARMEGLIANNQKEDDAYKRCIFLFSALKNGWLVSDIKFLDRLYDIITGNPDDIERAEGMDVLAQISTKPANTVEKRYEMLDMISHYMFTAHLSRVKASEKSPFYIDNSAERRIYQSEYPDDNTFKDYAMTVRGEEIAKYKYLQNKADKELELKNKKIMDARAKSTYVRKEITQHQRLNEKHTGFMQNPGQRHNNIVITNKEVISRVFGDEVYDEIDEMSTGSIEERTVPIYHSMGTKWAREGHEVLEMEFAGSGAQEMPSMHKKHNGVVRTQNLTPEMIMEKYGEKVRKSGDEYYDYIYKKDKKITAKDGKQIQKVKYNIAGATPDVKWISGLFNMGDYSIESNRANAQRFAKEFLEPHFYKWINNLEEPHDLMIMLSGHSRGAVSAGQGIKYIDYWITKYIERHPETEVLNLKKYVHYDYRSADAVPGAITNLRLSSCNLRNIPNVEATAFCSMGIQTYDILFPMQHIKGCKRIVLTNTDHLMDVFDVDDSQIYISGDRKKHADAYFDAETGEMYRKSGINQMPEGVYISDEKKNLIRISSYSQLGKLYRTYLGAETPQYTRHKNIHKMVRDWFVENDLKMSFPDEKTRGEETEKNLNIEDRILNSPNKRIAPVQREIRELIRLRSMDASKAEQVAQQEKLIKVCREYMKKTSIPVTEGSDSEYRMNLVSDLLSYTMRERNQLNKEISIEKGEKKRFDLDERIQAYHERLNKKEGYLERKQANEKKRLAREKDLLKAIKEVAAKCDEQIRKIENTSYFKGNSNSYEAYIKTLNVGKAMGENTSPNEFTNFLKQLTKVTDEYIDLHDGYIGPIYDDGKVRLNSAKDMASFSKRIGRENENNIKYYGDKDQPISTRVTNRNATISNLDAKIDAFEKAPKVVKGPAL